jgi:predicted nucleotidyltransferase
MLDNIGNIFSLRLFGSTFRGDSDAGSDLDILVVTDNQKIALHEVKRYFSQQKNVDFSIYSRERIIEMFKEGHLFAWHLYLESAPVTKKFEDKWFSDLGRPSEYKYAYSDLTQFLILLEEAISSIRSGSNYVFEAGICHVGLRNCSMIISYITTGIPNFSRYSVLELSEVLKLQMKRDYYDNFLRCRRISARGNFEIPPSKIEILKTLPIIEKWITVVRNNFNV